MSHNWCSVCGNLTHLSPSGQIATIRHESWCQYVRALRDDVAALQARVDAWFPAVPAPLPSALPDPDSLSGAELWERVEIEVGGKFYWASHGDVTSSWRNLGALMLVMREKHKMEFRCTMGSVGFMPAHGHCWWQEVNNAADLPTIAARLALKAVRGAKR